MPKVRLPVVKKIKKRDGSIVAFTPLRITAAVEKAMKAAGESNVSLAEKITLAVTRELSHQARTAGRAFIPTVEGVQDLVERQLIAHNAAAAAKAYILYRQRRAEVRQEKGEIPKEVRELVAQSKQYFRTALGEFVYYRTYARWIEEKGRRETWIETVNRYIDFMRENLDKRLDAKDYEELRSGILNQEAMPSMRLLQFSGPAARNTNVCAYNCSYIAPSRIQDFAEIMYISMCGTGVGWAVESQNIQRLPQVRIQTGKMMATYVIPDTKEGWCDALTLGMRTWYEGKDIKFDYSELRPAGARLKTMGGKSSGPEPLRRLLDFTRQTILRRQGRRISNLDAHDIICTIGDIVVSGGVRRSAMISLSDLDDTEIRDAKKGQFYLTEPQRALANNSAVYNKKPTASEFMEEWLALMKSGAGERGIFNRGGLKQTLPARRVKSLNGRINSLGTNPCAEIILQSKQFCNLSEVVARVDDDEKSLLRKIRLATILGTYQSTLTKFPYLSKEWKQNCEQERLLGVSITGHWDCPALQDPELLLKLKNEAIRVNKEYAKIFGVNASTCITCVKPSGTLSQMVDCASGMHPRHSPYYIRRVRISATDSLFRMLKDQGVPFFPEVGQGLETATTYVLEFPVKAPSHTIHYRDDISALEQLEHWKLVKANYTEHNPSVTVSVGENEWIAVAHWLYENWEIIGGLSFLPRDNHVYQLAPFEAIDKTRYQELLKNFEHIDFSKIMVYEKTDETEARKELACAAGVCEVAL